MNVRKTFQEAVHHVKQSRQMEERYMLLELEIKRERKEAKAEGKAEGKAEDIIELLEDFGAVPEELRDTIMQEQDLSVLKNWLKLAARVGSLEQFLNQMNEVKKSK